VTVIAGLKNWQGVVLLADTQETVGDSKRHAAKLRFEPNPKYQTAARAFYGGKPSVKDLAVAFCGAGEGPFIDKLIDLSWNAAKDSQSNDEACERIENTIKAAYREFGRIYQAGRCPEVELIYGVKMDGTARLFSAYGPVVNEKSNHCSSGVGSYMANFLLARMYADHLTIQQCVILAAYILFQAKEHVDGCGGDSHIAILRTDGASGLIEKRVADAITKNLGFSDHETGRLLLAVGDPSLTKEKYEEQVKLVIDALETWRGIQQKDFSDAQALKNHLRRMFQLEPESTDEFGLPTPSDSQM